MANRVIAKSPIYVIPAPDLAELEAAEINNAINLSRGVSAHQWELYEYVLARSNAGDPEARRIVSMRNTESGAREHENGSFIPFI